MKLRLGAVAQRLDAILSQAARERADATSTSSTQLLREETRSQAAQARGHGDPDRALPGRKNARGVRFQVPAVHRPEARARAGYWTLRRRRRECAAVRAARRRQDSPRRSRSDAPSSRPVTPSSSSRHHLDRGADEGAAEASSPSSSRFYAKPKLLVVDELGYLPFEKQAAPISSSSSSPGATSEAACCITSNQMVTSVGPRLRRRDDRRRRPRPAPPPQPRPDHPGRQLPTPTEEAGGPSRLVQNLTSTEHLEGVSFSGVSGSVLSGTGEDARPNTSDGVAAKRTTPGAVRPRRTPSPRKPATGSRACEAPLALPSS